LSVRERTGRDGDNEMTTLETLLCGPAVLAVALESHGTALVFGGLVARMLTHAGP
jgi:hypothetical protein